MAKPQTFNEADLRDISNTQWVKSVRFPGTKILIYKFLFVYVALLYEADGYRKQEQRWQVVVWIFNRNGSRLQTYDNDFLPSDKQM